MPWVTKHSAETYEPAPPPREYTAHEKAQNWWSYYKWLVFVGALAVVVIGITVWQIATQVKPDYYVGYVCPTELPVSTAAALQEQLAAYGEDRNGDGRVAVQLDQYMLTLSGPASGDPLEAAAQASGRTRLTSALDRAEGAYIWLLADPEGFQDLTGALAPLDGEAADWTGTVCRWQDCPLLTALELGDYETYAEDGETRVTLPGQGALADLYIGRRSCRDEEERQAFAGDEALWQALTAGAVPMEEQQ